MAQLKPLFQQNFCKDKAASDYQEPFGQKRLFAHLHTQRDGQIGEMSLILSS
jgi:hypothetical protein